MSSKCSLNECNIDSYPQRILIFLFWGEDKQYFSIYREKNLFTMESLILAQDER